MSVRTCFVRPRHSFEPIRSANRAGALLMTGVHWLLAHCSVLKVRTVSGLFPPSSPHSKKPPALSCADDPNAPVCSDRLRQASSYRVSFSEVWGPTRTPPVIPGAVSNGTPPTSNRQQRVETGTTTSPAVSPRSSDPPGTLHTVPLDEPLMGWYQARRRSFPWRGETDPYRVLVSEVMLQQTQASRVAPAYRLFIEQFPTLRSLAAASRADVLRTWGNLGYNRRAVALSEAARTIVRHLGGRVPSDTLVLRSLPGIGPYTAHAVAALAFGHPLPALDVNVTRVVSRARLGVEPGSRLAEGVVAAAQDWLDGSDPVDWNQAVMDLGREVCRPAPRCPVCPIAPACASRMGSVAPPAPERHRRKAAPYPGSRRQLRGRLVALLRQRPRRLGSLARSTGAPLDRVIEATSHLVAEGILSAGPAALRGSPRGLVRLAD